MAVASEMERYWTVEIKQKEGGVKVQYIVKAPVKDKAEEKAAIQWIKEHMDSVVITTDEAKVIG